MSSLCPYSANSQGLRGTDGSLPLEERPLLLASWAPASTLALVLLSWCLLSATPPKHDVEDPGPVYSIRAESERLTQSQVPGLGGTPREEPCAQSCSPHHTGESGPPEPKGHVGNFRQHQAGWLRGQDWAGTVLRGLQASFAAGGEGNRQ